MTEKGTWESFLKNLKEKAELRRKDAQRWVKVESSLDALSRADLIAVKKLTKKAILQFFKLWDTVNNLDEKGIDIFPVDFEDLKYEGPGVLTKIEEIMEEK